MIDCVFHSVHIQASCALLSLVPERNCLFVIALRYLFLTIICFYSLFSTVFIDRFSCGMLLSCVSSIVLDILLAQVLARVWIRSLLFHVCVRVNVGAIQHEECGKVNTTRSTDFLSPEGIAIRRDRRDLAKGTTTGKR